MILENHLPYAELVKRWPEPWSQDRYQATIAWQGLSIKDQRDVAETYLEVEAQ